jgi:hypothetical protein
VAPGDELPQILHRQARLDERLRDSNPLDIDRAKRAVCLACPHNAEFGEPLHPIKTHACPSRELVLCQS